VYGTPRRDFQESLPLGVIEIAAEFDLAIDSVEESVFRFTVPAIFGINSVMSEPDRNAVQFDSLPLCIQPQRHRRARTEACEQQFVRCRSAVRPEWGRLVSAKVVVAGNDLPMVRTPRELFRPSDGYMC
jgi:hypothetical protein